MIGGLTLEVRGRPVAVAIGRDAGRYFAIAELPTARGAISVMVAVEESVIHSLALDVLGKLRDLLGLSADDIAGIWDALADRLPALYLSDALRGRW